jgi:RNA polymerase sigma factor (sigma-70 family)
MTPRHLLEPARLAGGALLRAQSDARLVDMTRAGNDRAFEAIVGRYKGDLLRYCSRILHDGRADDAVQQVFVNAYRALHRDTTPLSLRSWLFGIAHNVALNVLRQRGGDHEPLEAHLGTEQPAHVTFEQRERLRDVLAAIAALPQGQRDALLLRELEGRGHDEIARELGITGGAARQLINRARNGVRSAAAAMLPMPLLMRLTSGTASPPSGERLAELTAVGGGVTITKVVATGAVGATLLGGAVTGPDLVSGDKERREAGVAEAAPPEKADATDSAQASNRATGNGQRATDGDRSGSNSGPGDGDAFDETNDDSSGPGSGDDDNSGPGSGDDDGDDDNSGPGSGDDTLDTDNSGPGSGDNTLDTDNSGPGSGDNTLDTDNSGPGSGGDTNDLLDPDDDSDNSGSGSDSDNSGPGSTG